MRSQILISSSELEQFLFLKHILEVEAFRLTLAEGFEELAQVSAKCRPQAILLECRSDSDVAPLCALLKSREETSLIPLVALIGAGAECQLIKLVKAGVDESFLSPLVPRKLIDHLRRLTSGSPFNPDARCLVFNDIEMNLDTYRVTKNGRCVHLGPIEFQILRHFIKHPGHVFSRQELIRAAWPRNIFVDARTVDVHIGQLRKALNTPSGGNVIRTVRSAGYALAESGDAALWQESRLPTLAAASSYA